MTASEGRIVTAHEISNNIMIESLKRIILDKSSEKIKLPVVLPIESMEGVTE